MSSMSHRRTGWRRLTLAAVASLAATSSPAASADPSHVKTHQGWVRGTTKASYRSFLGIPYARPPLGRLRWRAPQPPAAWHGVRDATAARHACAQGTSWDPGHEHLILTEDCLNLNIYTPSTRRRRLPVLVWIHGGGFKGGAGTDTNPLRLVEVGGVIVVTINYRLGAFGFLDVPQLAREDRGAAGDYGLLDQQAALRWVRRNIARFGGDPGRVTVAGHSSGATSVCAQLTSPAARGLFQRAILMSGPCSMFTRRTAEAVGAQFQRALGCSELVCMRRKSPAEILAAQARVAIAAPARGQPTFPVVPAQAIAHGAVRRVPVLIGQTRDEFRLFVFAATDYIGHPVTAPAYRSAIDALFGPDADAVLARYPAGSFWSPTVTLATVLSDANSCSWRTLWRRLARRVPTYTYEFRVRTPPPFVSLWRLHAAFPFGATHANDLPYLWEYLGKALPFSDAQHRLSDEMVRYWAWFVRRGNPNATPLPPWPRYRASSDEIMALNTPRAAVTTDFVTEHRCRFWALHPHPMLERQAP